MLIQKIYALCMIIMIVSFLGFVVENLWIACTKGFVDNRGMFLPFLLGYGLAVAAIYMVYGTPDKLWFLGNVWNIHNATISKLLYFLIVVACICIGEMLLGLIVEKVCHFSWWNYSRIPLHITQYTSIPTSVAFSILITTFMDVFFSQCLDTFAVQKIKYAWSVVLLCFYVWFWISYITDTKYISITEPFRDGKLKHRN